MFPTVEDVRERRGRLEHACEEAGREMLPLSVMTGVLVGADERELRGRAERLAELIGSLGGGAGRRPASGLDRGNRRGSRGAA